MEYIASISHGKDSIAMLHIIKDVLHLPLDRIITVDVWFDENTRAELPPMVEWKAKADKIIEDRWGIPVEHLCATRGGKDKPIQSCSQELPKQTSTENTFMDSQSKEVRGATRNLKSTYKDIFYHQNSIKKQIYGFPMMKGNWCNALKKQPINFLWEQKVGWCNI